MATHLCGRTFTDACIEERKSSSLIPESTLCTEKGMNLTLLPCKTTGKIPRFKTDLQFIGIIIL